MFIPSCSSGSSVFYLLLYFIFNNIVQIISRMSGGYCDALQIIKFLPKNFDFQIAKLTNEYYHLVPIHGFECETIQPISEKKMLREHTKLLADLMDLQVASSILLGANLRKSGMYTFSK